MSSKPYSTPEEAELAFYDAMERADIESMMSVWLDNDSIVCVHPGASRLEGMHDIRSGFQQMFEDPSPIMDFAITDVRSQLLDNFAIHTVREEIEVDGQLVSIMLATNIYQKTQSGWRMLLHHASPEPDMDFDELDYTFETPEPIVLH